jgi:predicted acyl esterase
MVGAAVGAAGLAAWGARRRWLGRLLDLPPARYGVDVERNLAVPMADGVVLRADHYWPRAAGAFPTILIRTPYGRGWDAPQMGLFSLFVAARFAERGYHVVVQTVRGRFDSGGGFDPRADDRADGRDTMAWIAAQPWFDGTLGMWGNSYLGYVQWAVAAEAPPLLKALVPSFTSATYYSRIYMDGAFGLANSLPWVALIAGGSRRPGATGPRPAPAGADGRPGPGLRSPAADRNRPRGAGGDRALLPGLAGPSGRRQPLLGAA